MNNGPWLDRSFSRLLLIVTAAGLIAYLYYGQVQSIDFDGWWHLFTATQDRWIIFLAEWKYETHPPLYYLLLRFVAVFGHSHLILRSISILSGCAGTYAMGIVAAKLYRYKASALIAAAAYALAWNMIEINCAVRAYAPALLFVLLAFNAYIDWNVDPLGPRAGRAIVRFGVYSLLALLNEYYVIFFLAACVGALTLRFLTQPVFRAALLESLHLHWKQWLFSSASTITLFLAFFVGHMNNVYLKDQHYLDAYYWSENSPLGLDGFLLTNFEKETGLFTPFNIDPGVMLAIAVLVMLPALIYLAFIRKDRWHGPIPADPLLLLLSLLAQLVVLSLAGRHPFGGEFRHQSIIAPFVFLTAFLLLDRLADALKPPVLRNALFAVAGVLVAASFASGWAFHQWSSVEPKTEEFLRFRAVFPAPETVYGDVVSTIFYYVQTHRSQWTFQDRFLAGDQRILVYQVDDGSGHPMRVMRNKREAYLDLLKPEAYRVLAEALRHQNLKSAVLYYNGLSWNAEGTGVIEAKVRELAPQNGLELGRSLFGQGYAFVEFKLR